MLKKSILSLLILSFLNSSYSQVVGSHDNSDMIPKEAKASSLKTGIVSGDVNLFTGDYQSSMSLGSVGTPGGLSFNLSLNYSSTYVAGTSPIVAAGIPYGEGWNLSIPTISVSNAAYFSFTIYQEHYKRNNATGPVGPLPDGLDTNYYDQTTGAKNGDIYWYSPTVSIPGYVSGKAVFKHLEDNGNTAVFILNKFDKYVELRFDGSRWEVMLDNGLIYELGVALVSYRTPNNQRVLNYNTEASLINNGVDDVNNDDYTTEAKMVKNSIEPKAEITTWYCSEIRNKNIEFQYIKFDYEKFGEFNFFKEYEQPVLANQIGSKLFETTDPTPGGFNGDFTVYRDILLSKISSGSISTTIEVLDLQYSSVQVGDASLIGFNMLDFNDSDVERKDSLYSYKVIDEQGTAGNFNSEWSRYLHGKETSQLTYNYGINSSNPYIVTGNKYIREINQGGSNSLPFNHGFLESKRISSSDVVSGDIYEIKTKVIDQNGSSTAMGNGTLDIAVVTGGCGISTDGQGNLNSVGFNSLNGNSGLDYSGSAYTKTRGEQIYSTFNNAIKWQVSAASNNIETSNYFVMPNIPTTNGGVNIQIGPGGSDNNYAKDGSVIGGYNNINYNPAGTGQPSAYNSYAHRMAHSIPSYGNVPSNFGIGLPWSMVLPLYAPGMGGYASTNGLRDPKKSGFAKFWWNDSQNGQGPNWNNKPTKFDEDVHLKEFQLIRYSKNPYMLASVKKLKLNGEQTQGSDNGMTLIEQKDFSYDRSDTLIYENYNYSSVSKRDTIHALSDANNTFISNVQLYPQLSPTQIQNIYTLTKITEVPTGYYLDSVHVAPTTNNLVQTDLDYSWYGSEIKKGWTSVTVTDTIPLLNIVKTTTTIDSIRLNPGRKSMLLTKITNPLGGEDHIEYYPANSATNWHNTAGNNKPQSATGSFSKKSYANSRATVHHPSVKSIIRNKDLHLPGVLSIDSTLENKTDYFYDTTNIIWETEDIHIPENFRNAYQVDFQKGFQKVTTVNSELATGERNYSISYFGGKVNPNTYSRIEQNYTMPPSTLEEYLFFGKLLKVENYNSQDLLESSTEWTYDYTLAHKNGTERASIYRNNYANPHSDFERFSGTSAGYHDYEYGDYYRGDVFQTNELITGCLSNEILGTQEGTGCMTPYFYADLLPLNDVRYFRSYFTKLISKSEKNYDQSCLKPTNPSTGTVYNDYTVPHDPFGTSPSNPKPSTPAFDQDFIELISDISVGNGNITDTVIGVSPVSDTIIDYILKPSGFISNDEIHDIMLHQNPLADTFLISLFHNSQNLRPQQLINVFKNQPYITDAVQAYVIDNFENTENSVLTEILNHNAYLSDIILESIFNKSGFPEVVINDVVMHQPQLNSTTLNNLIATASEVEAFNIVEILSAQAYLSDDLFEDILDNETIDDKDKAEILVRSASYPTDTEIIDNYLDLDISAEAYLDIVTASPYVFTGSLNTKIVEFLKEEPLQVYQMAQGGLIGYEKYCINPTTCSNGFIETKEDYSYFEASHTGATLAEGYKKLLGLEDVETKTAYSSHTELDNDIILQNIKLKHEPSWQLYSVKSYSPQYPSAFVQKEYFYYFDELNRQDRHIEYYDVEYSSIEYEIYPGTTYDTVITIYENSGGFLSNPPVLYGQVPLSDGGRCSQRNFLRNIPFQETTTSKNINDEDALQKSFYYLYDTKIHKGGNQYNKIIRNYSGPNCDSLTNATNCNDNIIGYVDHAYTVSDAETLGDLPNGYCAYEIDVYGGPIYFVKAGFDFSNCSQMQGVTDSIRQIGCNDGSTGSGGSQGFVLLSEQFTGRQIGLKDVIVQIDTVPNTSGLWANRLDKSNNYIAYFNIEGQDANGLWEDEMVFPFDTMSIRTIDALNNYGQIALEHNQTGIYTKYNYDFPIRYWNINDNAAGLCVGLGSYSSYESTNIGVPTSITVGHNRVDSMTTDYDYYPNYRLKSIITPNNIHSKYVYDDYGRLHEAYSNNRLLSRTTYNYWDHNIADDYLARSSKNYVESYAFNDTISSPGTYNGTHNKSFMDINGREIQAISAVDNDQEILRSPTTEYDNWGRAIRTFKPHFQDTLGGAPLDIALSAYGYFQKFLYENNTKSRLKRSAAFGINQIQSVHTVKQSHQIVNDVLMTCELSLSASEIEMLMGGSYSTGAKFYKSVIEDEDGKTMATYTTPTGQKIATLQFGSDLNDEIVTLFGYDSYGNLSKVINPGKQISTYSYNILGQLYKQNTVDAGDTKYMYNKIGKVALKQTQNSKAGKVFDGNNVPYFTKYEYDDYGKLLVQKLASKSAYVNGSNNHNYPLFDYLNYSDSAAGLNSNQEPTYINGNVDQDYFEYEFSNKSTYWWLADVKVMLPPAGQGGPTAGVLKIKNMIFDQNNEKSFTYGHNTIDYSLGKLTRSVDYDAEGNIVQTVDVKYNEDGNLLSEEIEFNPLGKPTLASAYTNTQKTVAAKITYSDYNYLNAARETSVDIGNDGFTDFQYHYDFSEWNRLERVYFNYGDNDQHKTDITLYLYEPTTGQNTDIKHLYQPYCAGQTSIPNVVFAQNIHKTYDERNRLIDQDSELFDYTLYYDDQSPTSIYGQPISASQNWNGNINGMTVNYTPGVSNNYTSWQNSFDKATVYGYKYDNLNRLIAADGSQGNLINNTGQQSQSYSVGDVYYQFDKIGNFTSVQREKVRENSSPIAYLTDQWAYQYAPNTNKLLAVSASNGTTVSRQYTYDNNGNLLSDDFRDLNSIEYYRDNFPVQINKTNESIHYLYGTDDIRNYKKVIDLTSTQPTSEEYYLKNIGIFDMLSGDWTYYVNGISREAKITPDGNQTPAAITAVNSVLTETNAKKLDISFYINDYLGNTRIVYKPNFDCTGGGIETANTYMADYYPYGKILREFKVGPREKFLSTSHERDYETGTGEGNGLDYRGARFYDSDVGRFLSLDPLAADYPSLSDYVYVANNPIRFIDPDGKKIVVYGERYGFLNLRRHKYQYQSGSTGPEGSSQFVKDAFTALNHVSSADENGIIDMVSESKKTVKIKEAEEAHDTYYADERKTIFWDSRTGLRVYDNNKDYVGNISPALALFHEVAHSFRHFFKKKEFWTDQTEPDPNYDDIEEKKVIENYEVPAAKKLGEAERENHRGTPTHMTGPNSTIPAQNSQTEEEK